MTAKFYPKIIYQGQLRGATEKVKTKERRRARNKEVSNIITRKAG